MYTRKRIQQKKGQVSMEFMLCTGLLFLIFLSLLVITNNLRTSLAEFEYTYLFEIQCEEIAERITDTYIMGEGATMRDFDKHNITILGNESIIHYWAYEDDFNRSTFCPFSTKGVTNGEVNSFFIPEFAEYVLRRTKTGVELYEATHYDNLAVWLTFDEESRESSVIQNKISREKEVILNATLRTSESGLNTNAVNISQTGEYVEMNDSSAIRFDGSTQDFTICLLFQKNDASDTDMMMINKLDANGDGYALRINGANRVEFSLNGITLQSTEVQNTLEWKHVCVVADRSDLATLYINGTQTVDNVSIASQSLSTSSPLRIGLRSYIASEQADMVIDDVRIYNKTLTNEEIERLYQQFYSFAQTYPEYLETNT